ncbi:hypothetical protein C8J57DRAFT_1334814, partial [Mycena rebaudengoi]
IAAVTSFSGARAQGACLQNSGYLGEYDANSGSFVGAVVTLSRTGDRSKYLSVATFSNACNDGGPVYIEILNPIDSGARYISLVAGVTDCTTAAFTGSAPWAAIAAADGNPHNIDIQTVVRWRIPVPWNTKTTLQGGYGNLKTFCGENMVFALGNAFGRQVLLPAWSMLTGLPVVPDNTFNRLLATPNPATYSAFYSGASVQQVYLSIFFP